MKKNDVMKVKLKVDETHKVFKVVGKNRNINKLVFESYSLEDCFQFLIDILRKEKMKAEKLAEEELQNFLDFGEM